MFGYSTYEVPAYVMGAHVGATPSANPVEQPKSIVGGSSPEMYAAGAVGNGVIAAALLVPFGFKQRHEIWGSIFGAGALWNVMMTILASRK